MSHSTLTPSDYILGWICAQYKHLAVAEQMLDEIHQSLAHICGDDNIYRFGAINNINIVITCLPDGRMGAVSTANVAKDIRRSFPNIRMGLLVGIGGGVPQQKAEDENREWGDIEQGRASGDHGVNLEEVSDDDDDLNIRLGDVVVSRPVGTNGGVIQYDFGKAKEHGTFLRTGSLNRPPDLLMSAVSAIRSLHERQGNSIAETVLQMVVKRPKMKAKYAYSNSRRDVLFRPDSYHVKGQKTCRFCSIAETIRRPDRKNSRPVVHYGLIASGNGIMKDGMKRDLISSQAGGVLCFETMAAGVMDSFPCLVIQGICNYCDGHRNDKWQGYAAAVAAAYAKELIGVLPPMYVPGTPVIEENCRGWYVIPPKSFGDAKQQIR